MAVKKIYLGSDHAGFELKERLKNWFEKKKILYVDLGNLIFNPKDDYPDYASLVAKKVTSTGSLGILICGSAQGMCIAANKIKGARAVIPFSLKETHLSREHNHANILCLSGRFTRFYKAKKMVEMFLNTPFSKEPRHLRRLNKIKKLEA